MPKDKSLGKRLSGMDSVKLSLKVDLSSLKALLAKLIAAFESDSYKKGVFSWVDQDSNSGPGLAMQHFSSSVKRDKQIRSVASSSDSFLENGYFTAGAEPGFGYVWRMRSVRCILGAKVDLPLRLGDAEKNALCSKGLGE